MKNQKTKSSQNLNLDDQKQETKPESVTEPDTNTIKEKEIKDKPAIKETRKSVQNKRNAFVVTPPNDNTGSHKFFIQADALATKAAAEKLAADLTDRTRRDWFVVYEDNLFKVRLGYFDSKDEAKYMEGTLNTPGIMYYIDEISAEESDY